MRNTDGLSHTPKALSGVTTAIEGDHMGREVSQVPPEGLVLKQTAMHSKDGQGSRKVEWEEATELTTWNLEIHYVSTHLLLPACARLQIV